MHAVTCRTPPPLTPLAEPTLRRNLDAADNLAIAASAGRNDSRLQFVRGSTSHYVIREPAAASRRRIQGVGPGRSACSPRCRPFRFGAVWQDLLEVAESALGH